MNEKLKTLDRLWRKKPKTKNKQRTTRNEKRTTRNEQRTTKNEQPISQGMKDKIKSFIKRYFSSFAYFYRYLRNKIFIAFFLSVFVSILDGLGLTMFIPLLQVIGEEGMVDAQEMGKLSYVITGLEDLGIPHTVISVHWVMIVFLRLNSVALCDGLLQSI